MNRSEKITYLCNLKGKGLEIGPSFNPVLPKKEGYDVETIDHLDKKGLIEKYREHGVNLDNIEEVDYIWQGEKYTELTEKSNYYDYIIASHVIEHTCDMIGFLNDCSELLKENGILSLVIPNKKFCFDFFRPVTSISRVVDSYLEKRVLHSSGTICEHFLNASCYEGNIAWGKNIDPSNLRLVHSYEASKKLFEASTSSSEYIDAHNWTFTEKSFELLIYDLNCLKLTCFQVAESFETVGVEFYISLKKCDSYVIPNDDKRFQLLVSMHNELQESEKISESLKFLEAQVSLQQTEINSLQKEINISQTDISTLKGELSILHAEKDAQYVAFINSTSWKMTAPFRVIICACRRIFER